jgi:CSLREA domain-containing protein
MLHCGASVRGADSSVGMDLCVQPAGVMVLHRFAGLLLVVLVAASSSMLPPSGATDVRADLSILVTATNDDVDVIPGDGICETAIGNGVCTLRAAIQEANALSGGQTIVVPQGTFVLTRPGRNEDAAATGDLDITDSVTIVGQGWDLTSVDASQIDRAFHLAWRSGPEPVVILRGLRGAVLDGNGQVELNGQGGGILNDGQLTLDAAGVDSSRAYTGGGIWSGRPLIVKDSVIIGNQATVGGGIASTQQLTVVSTLIASNSGASSYGAGIDSRHSSSITNTTFSENQGIALFQASTAGLDTEVLNSTFFGTSTSIDTTTTGGRVYIQNTLLASAANNCWTGQANLVTSRGHNLERVTSGSSTCDLSPSLNDVTTSNPGLQVLADNGGPTQTHALNTSSPAIDAGTNAGCPSTDQRGFTRPYDGDANGIATCDIGAFEAPSVRPTATSTPIATMTITATTTVTPTVTATLALEPTATSPASLTPTSTSVLEHTPTPSPTRTLSPSLTPTSTTSICAPRPPVRVSTESLGNGALRVTVRSGEGPLRAVRFNQSTNATVEVPGESAQSGSFIVALPTGATEMTFTARRLTPGAFTVPFVAVDGCGDWHTFIGAGPSLP